MPHYFTALCSLSLAAEGIQKKRRRKKWGCLGLMLMAKIESFEKQREWTIDGDGSKLRVFVHLDF